jgi:hypothetical protein
MPQRSRRRSPLSSGTPQRMCRASSTVTPRVRTFRCQTERRSAGCPGTCAGGFCCLIGFRWQPGTEALPGYCLGHIGCTVVPWKQRRGYATEALRLLLPDTKAEGLRCVEVTTDIGNAASQRVIEANGGVLVARFTKPPSHGGTEALRFRILLGRAAVLELQGPQLAFALEPRDRARCSVGVALPVGVLALVSSMEPAAGPYSIQSS